MDTGHTDKLRAALGSLRDSHEAAQAAFQEFEEHDLSKENVQLHEAVRLLNVQLEESRRETQALTVRHEQLSDNFKHELEQKRLAMVGMSERKYQDYLKTSLEREHAQTTAIYVDLLKAVDSTAKDLRTLDTQMTEPLRAEVENLHRRVKWQAEQTRENKRAAYQDFAHTQKGVFDEVKDAPVQDSALHALRKFFSLESFMGLKIVGAIGALLLIIAVYLFSVQHYIGPAVQNALIFALGVSLMGAGEVFYRKKWQSSFSLALTAGGAGILFLSTALGYMTLGVLPMMAAVAICAAVSLLTFAASIRYNAQLIAVFALIGGYLPVLALEGAMVFFGAIYFTFLSLLVLLIATRKNWRVARFIGLGAGLVAELTLIVTGLMAGMIIWGPSGPTHVVGTGDITVVGLSIAVGLVAYIVIPVFGAWFTKTQINAQDIVLLSCNIFFRFLLALLWGSVYAPAAITAWQAHTQAILALISTFFAVCCIVMALVVERQKHSGLPDSETGSLRALFFITSVSFTGLIVLFALDSAWFSAGWLIQATGLALYGIFKNRRRFSVAALAIGGFCLSAFLLVNLPNAHDPLFIWQYASITIAAAVVATASLRCKLEGAGVVLLDIFRGVAAFNVWLFVVYLLSDPLFPIFMQWFYAGAAWDFAYLLTITLGFAFAFTLPRIPRLRNCGFRVGAVSVGVVCMFMLFYFNSDAGTLSLIPALLSRITIFVLYLIVNIIAIAWVNNLLRLLSELRRLPLGWYPVLISGFAVLLATQNIVVQFSLAGSRLILTLLFSATALCWVLFGFLRRNSATRLSGLAMAFFVVAKLFVMDLFTAAADWRVVSYFIAGGTLLAVSYTYQWFNKKLEAQSKEAEKPQ